MRTLKVTPYNHNDWVDGKYYLSLYLVVEGVGRFSRVTASRKQQAHPGENLPWKHLLERLRSLLPQYRLRDQDCLLFDIVAHNVILIQLEEGTTLNRNIVIDIYDLIHGYCLMEEELLATRAFEHPENLLAQVQQLLFLLQNESLMKNCSGEVLTYLTTSIRYGTLDTFGGIIPPAPKNHEKATLLEWVAPLSKLIEERRRMDA